MKVPESAPGKNLSKLHENPVIFPLNYSQDFNGFCFHSVTLKVNVLCKKFLRRVVA